MTLRRRLGTGNLSLAQQVRGGLRGNPRESRGRHALRLLAFTVAVFGGLAGLWVLWMHITGDPLADAHAYYLAASRLNHGEPLYPPGFDPTSAEMYRYPPLLAVILRPLALLPYWAFAVGWELLVVGAFVLTIVQLGAGPRVYLAIGILGIPIGWALGVAQAQVPLTLLIAIGQPWTIALATNIKLFPALIALWWIGRRNYESFFAFIAWLVIFGLAQFVIEANGTLAYLHGAVGLGLEGEARNISPYVWASPLVWASLFIVAMLVTVALARTRWGWAAAVTLATLSPPRLLVYALTGLLAAVQQPRIAGEPDPDAPLDTASAFLKAVR